MFVNITNSQACLTYIGHATALIELNGVRLLTDPILRGRLMHLRHRNPPDRSDVYQDIDAVLISHLHFDHLDFPSLKMLGPATRFIVPRGAGLLLRQHGFKQVEEIEIGEVTHVNTVTISAIYARHDRRRHLFGPTADCLGFIIGGTYTLYFAGDTDLFPEMVTLAGRLDVALLPVWGWGPTLGKGHMDPFRAARALRLLQPRLAIPIHWGVLHPWGLGWLNPRFLTTPPYEFVDYAARLATEVKTQIVAPGDSISLEEVFR